jgi:hypothetical protein
MTQRMPRLRPNLLLLERRDVPATITVTSLGDAVANDGFVTLREALNSINMQKDTSDVIADITEPYGTNDQINFAVNGTILLTGGQLSSTKAMKVNGPGPGLLTIQQTTAARVWLIANGLTSLENFEISGLTITGGNLTGNNSGGGFGITTENVTFKNCVITGNATEGGGGGIGTTSDANAIVTLIDCVVSNNRATTSLRGGGGIRMRPLQSLTVINSTITGNSASQRGAGIYFIQPAYFSALNSTISNNRTGGGGGATNVDAQGGGLAFAGAATGPILLTNCTIANNEAQQHGGGVAFTTNFTGQVEFNYCTISGNKASVNGGGIARDALTTAGVSITLNGTVVANNSAPIFNDVFVMSANTLTVNNTAIGSREGYVIATGSLAVAPGTPLLLGIPSNHGGGTQSMRPVPGSPLINVGGTPVAPTTDQTGVNNRIDGPAADIGSLEVISANPSAPVPVLAVPLATVDKPGDSSYFVTITYYDDGLVDASTIDPTDLIVTGKPGATVSIPSPPMVNAASVTVTYVITPPGGAWDISDNALYTITLAPNAVSDTLGNMTTTGTVGTVYVGVGNIYIVTNTDPNAATAGSLGKAITDAMAANPQSGLVDLIRFDPTVFNTPQTITLTAVLPTLTDSVYIEGPGMDLLTIRQVGNNRLFLLDSDNLALARDMTITGMTLREASTGNSSGAAIRMLSEFLTLRNVRMTANQADQVGAAISAPTTTGSRITVIDSEITNNLTNGTGNHGAGISTSEGPTHFVHVRNSIMAGNSAGGGGAIYSNNSNVLIENSYLAGNQQIVGSGTVGGGALFISSAAATPDSGRTVMIRNSTITENQTVSSLGTSAGGGGIYIGINTFGLVRITNSTIANNVSPVKGGGISYAGGSSTVQLVNSIVDGNLAPIGPDIEGPGSPFSEFSLIGQTSPPVIDLGGTKTSTPALLTPVYNFGGLTPARATLPGSPAREVGAASDSKFDQRGVGFPRVVGMPDMGALEFALGTPIATAATIATMTFSPITKSGPDYTFKITYHDEAGILDSTIDGDEIRVINAKSGYNKLASVVSKTGPATQREVTYKILPPNLTAWNFTDNGDYVISLEAGKVTDTGMAAIPATTFGTFSVGISAITTVTSAADDGPGTLRQALADINLAGAPATINFDTMGVFASAQTITLTTGELSVGQSVTLIGTGVNQLTISGNVNSRIFNIFNSDKLINFTASNLTIRDGKQFESTNDGGAIYNNGEALVLNNVVLVNNSTAGSGGAIYSQGGTVNLTQVVGDGNSATGRAGTGGFLFINTGGTVSLAQSSITGNTSFAGGGAFYIAGASTITLDRSTVANNHSLGNSFGGGFYMGAGTTLTASNTTISRNSASLSGGGIRLSNVTITLDSCTVAENVARNRTPSGVSGGGGIYRSTGGASAVVNLNNTVVANNYATGGIGDDMQMQGQAVNCDSAVVFDPNGWTLSGSLAVSPGTPVLLGPLTNNGGGFLTHLPAPTSPLRDASLAVMPPAIDQLGTARPIGAAADIGAIESNGKTPVGIPNFFPDVTSSGGTNYQFVVTYYDDVGIDTTTINNGNIRVVGPNGFDVPANVMMQAPVAGGVEVTYQFAAPGGTWDNFDAGLYSIQLLANQVKDSSMTAVAAATLGQFRVQLARNYVVTNTNASGPGSLRQAFLNANDIQGTDGIDSITFDPTVFSGAQTITLNDHIPVTDSVTVTGTGNKILTVNTVGRNRHFLVNGPGIVQFELTDITLTGGKLFGNATGADAGGSINIENESVTLRRVNLTNNSTNTAIVAGGAITILASGGKLVAEDCLFENNTARIGGAIRVSELTSGSITVELKNSIVRGNSATSDGGALSVNSGSITATDTVFENNSSAGNGGAAIFTKGGFTNRFENCLFEGNTAVNGGALRLTDTAGGIIVNIFNSTLSGNSSSSAGGAISNNGGSLSIFNSTIAKNSAANLTLGGGGIRQIIAIGPVFLENTIVANNTAPVNPDVSAAVPITANNTIIENKTGSNATGTNILNVDPLLGPLANNGGKSKTHALLPGSPAIDAGTNLQGLFTDQRGAGFFRNYDDPLTVNGMFSDGTDIGAFEFQPSIPQVVSVVVNGGGVQRSLVTSLVVNFNNAVNFPDGIAAAFQVQRYANGGAATVGLDFNPTTGPTSTVTITFNSSQMPLNPGGSLQDGTYRLTINASKVSNSVGTLDGNGNFILEGSPTDDYIAQFHRLFGDADGNGAVTATDFNAFRLDYGSSGPSIFDYDNAGGVSAIDFNEFRLRYGATGYLP